MKDLKKHLPPVSRKAEGFDEALEIADFDVFERGLEACMQNASTTLKDLPPGRMPENFEVYLHRLEAYLERCDTQLRECEALFDPGRYKKISTALSEIRLKILARELDPKFEKEFERVRTQVLETQARE